MSGEDLNYTSRTDWAALAAMDDEEIDYSDIPPLTEEFFEKATLRIPASKAQQFVQIEPDVLQWFQAQGAEYRTLINSVLRRYMESQHERSGI